MTMRGESVFLDTNILLSASDRDRSAFAACRQIISRPADVGYHLYIGPQVVREYIVVATRPVEVNGLGLTGTDALHNIGQFQRRTIMVGESEKSVEKLLTLISQYSVSGKRIHDANIIAVMFENGISCLLTLNTDDFKTFSGIELYTPQAFLREI